MEENTAIKTDDMTKETSFILLGTEPMYLAVT